MYVCLVALGFDNRPVRPVIQTTAVTAEAVSITGHYKNWPVIEFGQQLRQAFGCFDNWPGIYWFSRIFEIYYGGPYNMVDLITWWTL